MPYTEHYPTSTKVIAPTTVYTGDAGGDTTHTVDAALVQADDYWNNRTITYLTGDNAGLSRLITDFVALTDTLTHTAFPNTCDAGDTFYLGAWISPENAYAYDNAFAYSETDLAEQEYDGYYGQPAGAEIIDKVFIRLKWKSTVTTVVQGDTGSGTCTVKAYDGSTWETYQVTSQTLAVSTVNDESLVASEGDNANVATFIDVTAHVSTLAELQNMKTRLLFATTVPAGVTVRWSVDAVSILVCYHAEGGPFITGTATTKRDLDRKEYHALNTVAKYLEATSQ